MVFEDLEETSMVLRLQGDRDPFYVNGHFVVGRHARYETLQKNCSQCNLLQPMQFVYGVAVVRWKVGIGGCKRSKKIAANAICALRDVSFRIAPLLFVGFCSLFGTNVCPVINLVFVVLSSCGFLRWVFVWKDLPSLSKVN